MPAKLHDDKRRHSLLLHPEYSHKVWMPEPAVNASLEQQLRQSLPTLCVGNFYSYQAVVLCPFLLLFAGCGGEAAPEGMLRWGGKAGLIHHPKLAVAKQAVALNVNVGNTDKDIAVKTKRRGCNLMKCHVEHFVGLRLGGKM